MDLETAIKKRRSIRKYNDEIVSDDEMRKIIEAGTYAPSACNIQGWHFIILEHNKIIDLFNRGGEQPF
ncbi:MAG: nitroreductase family protein [Mucispirillum sp.]|nr:nitroreductase family protein [Mucispirillum sp.]